MSNDQLEYWNAPAAERWVEHQAVLECALRHFDDGRAGARGATPR